jgi:amidophosphoribosyltransferase
MIHDECGVFAAFDPSAQRNDAARLLFLGLFALQHRGEDSAGIAVNQLGSLLCQRRKGLVTEGFDEVAIQVLKGHAAIGHVRYPSAQDTSLESAQPMLIKSRRGQIALAFNGALTNASELRSQLQEQGAIFQSRADSEIILALLARHQVLNDNLETALRAMMSELQGAYAMVLMTQDRVVGMRDPQGIRPLCIGKTQDTFVLSSESCAIDAVDGSFLQEFLLRQWLKQRLAAHASSSMFILPARTASSIRPMSLPRGSPPGLNWPKNTRAPLTW